MTWPATFSSVMHLAGLGSLLAMASCAPTCSIREHQLSVLRRDMTYDEVTQVMGCTGAAVTGDVRKGDGFAIVEWNGLGSVFRRTQLDFANGRLLSFTTVPVGAL
jgi:hypothetical protein